MQLDPGRCDQSPVGDAAALLEHDPIPLGFERHDRAADPPDALGHHRRHRPLGAGTVEHAAPDQRPAGLVVVALARLDHRDPERGPAPQQAGGGRETRRAAADDDDVVGLGRGELDHPGGAPGQIRGPPAHLEARFQSSEVVAGLGRGGEDRARIEMTGLGERPERGRARAGTAEREHGPLHLVQDLGERSDVVVGDLARDHRHVPVFQADAPGRRSESRARWLILSLAVRAVVDHRPEPLCGERAEVGLGDLGRDGKKWRELGDLHDVRAPVARLVRALSSVGCSGQDRLAARRLRACRPES